MKLNEVQNIRDDILKDFDEHHRSTVDDKTNTESVVSESFDRRIAAGFSVLQKGNCRIELRVQRKSGPAWAFAESLKSKYKSEVNVDVVGTVVMPPTSDVRRNGTGPLIGKSPVLCPGLSVCHRDTRAGTIGLIVELQNGPALLSAAHVIGKSGSGEKNDPIYHPGKPDVDPLGLSYRVAKLTDSVDLSDNDINEIDAAVGVLNEGIEFTNCLPQLEGCPDAGKPLKRVLSVRDLASMGPNLLVAKVGRTTGYTTGKLTALDVKRLPVRTPRGNYSFGSVIEVTWSKDPFTRPGDSGSLVYVRDPMAGIGLHFASDGKSKSYACELKKVLDHFGATPVDC